MRIYNVGNYGASKIQDQQSTFKTNYVAKSNPISNEVAFAATCNTQEAVSLFKRRGKLPATKAQKLVSSLQLNMPVTGGLTGADLLRLMTGFSRQRQKDAQLLHYGEFWTEGFNSYVADMFSGVNSGKLEAYIERLRKGPLLEKREVYYLDDDGGRYKLRDQRSVYYGDAHRFSTLGNGLNRLTKGKTPKPTPKAPQVEPTYRNMTQGEIDSALLSGEWG